MSTVTVADSTELYGLTGRQSTPKPLSGYVHKGRYGAEKHSGLVQKRIRVTSP